MRLFAEIRFTAFSLFVLLFLIPSVISGQAYCENEAGRVRSQGNRACTCDIINGLFRARCFTPDDQKYDTNPKFAYLLEVTDGRVTELTEEYRQGLKNGRIKLPDGSIVTFTPYEEATKYISPKKPKDKPTSKLSEVKVSRPIISDPTTVVMSGRTHILENSSLNKDLTNQQIQVNQSQIVNQFKLVKEQKGLDAAVESYRKLLNNPYILIKNDLPQYFENSGDEFQAERNYSNAIKLYQLNAEINSDSGTAFFKLAEAYANRFNTLADRQPKDRGSAIINYEKAIDSKNTIDEELRKKARENIMLLKNQQ